MSSPNSRHLVSRLHNIDVRQSILADTFPKMMSMAFPNVKYIINKSDQYATFPHNGAEIWFSGLDDKERVEKILGKEYASIYVNESSQVAYETILTLRTRLAQSCQKADGRPLALKFYVDLNPVGRSHWTYREWIENVFPANNMPVPPTSRAYVVLNPTDNPNLPAEYLEELQTLPEVQRQRFLDGNYLSEVPGTLWPVSRIDETRVAEAPQLTRIVVALDPSGSDGTGGDSQGIIVAGKGIDGHAYVLGDYTCRLSPAGWGNRVVDLYHKYKADVIVAEVNYGGAMVESTIKTADPYAKVKIENASRGKHLRAEPVAALYEGGAAHAANGKVPMVHHVGRFPELEDQMAMFTTTGYQGGGSPDRVDALVWALTELMLNKKPPIVISGQVLHRSARGY